MTATDKPADELGVAFRADPAGPPAGTERPRRSMGLPMLAVAAVTIAVIAAGWAPEHSPHRPDSHVAVPASMPVPTSSRGVSPRPALRTQDDTHLLTGLPTDATGRVLVATYLGGGCNFPDHLMADQTATTISVRIEAQVPSHPSTVCPDVAIGGLFLLVTLAAPLGRRSVVAAGATVVPFDGRTLLTPTYLPPGYRPSAQFGGFSTPRRLAPRREAVANRWGRGWDRPASPRTACAAPNLGEVRVDQDPRSTVAPGSGFVSRGLRTFGGTAARLYRQGSSDRQATQWSFTWNDPHETVTVRSAASCGYEDARTGIELVRIAASLRRG